MTSSTGFKTRPVTLVVILVALLAFFKAEGKVVSYNATEPSNPENRTVRRPPVDRGKMDTAKKIAAARERCFDEVLTKPYPTDGRLYCNRTWDGWGCWNDTPAGEVAYTNCPSFMEGFDPWLKANKICTINGTWWIHPMTGKRWSNYTTCVDRTGMQALLETTKGTMTNDNDDANVVGYDPEPGDPENREAPRQPVGRRDSEQQKKNIAEARERCFEEFLSKPYPADGRLYCNRTWDGIGCWNDTPAGEMAYINCPRLKGFDVRLKASKTCTINGTWWAHPMTGRPWSNYTSCIDLSQRIEVPVENTEGTDANAYDSANATASATDANADADNDANASVNVNINVSINVSVDAGANGNDSASGNASANDNASVSASVKASIGDGASASASASASVNDSANDSASAIANP